MLCLSIVAFAILAAPGPAVAQEAHIAVAANFTAAAEDLGAAFRAETGSEIAFSFGRRALHAFLSADTATPARLLDEGLAVEGSDFTYAMGKLVLFSTIPDLVTGPQSLEGDFTHLAIAEPAAAPYGAAAIEVIKALELTETLEGKLVIGQNISQTYQFVDTANAELGFVALSQVAGRTDGSRWVVDEDLYTPITQDVVLLSPDNDTAVAFLDFLTSDTARTIIQSFGYGTIER